VRKYIISLVFTALGILLIVYFVPFREIFQNLRQISLISLITGLFFYTLSYIFRTLRWKIYYPEAPLGYLFLTTSANTFLNNVIPARLGELSIFAFLKKFDENIKQTTLKFLKVRLLDAISIMNLFLFAYLTIKTNVVISILISLWLYPVVVFLTRLISFNKLPKLSFEIRAYLLSLGNLISKTLAVYIVLEFLNLDFFRFVVGFLGGEISSVLPIHSFAGLGTYESAFSLSLKLFLGESFKEGFKVGFLSHSFLLFASLLLGGFSLLYLLRGKFSLIKPKREQN
jgi:uncharacterized membrane protein YbhN (UPF0104 family)